MTGERNTAPNDIGLWTIVSTDVFASLLAWMLGVAVVCGAAIVIHALATGNEPQESWSGAAIGLIGVCAVPGASLWARAARIRSLLASGDRVRASAHDFFSLGYSVRVKLSYDYQGEARRQTMVLPRSRRTRLLETRNQVSLVVHRKDPRRALIADLYEI
jgi:hypothetical protein